jgi:F-type H+-transporting ATPase subunit b
MHIDWSTLALQLLNFGILVWLLQRFLYRPVLRMIDARRAAVRQQYAEAHKAESEARERLAAVEAERAAIASERVAALKAAAAIAERETGLLRAQAEKDTQALMEQTRQRLAHERDQLLGEARTAAFELAAEIIRRLLGEQPAILRTQAWLDQIEQRLAELPQGQRTDLVQQLTHGRTLTVLTALPLDNDSRRNWSDRLHNILGPSVSIDYGVDPSLISGAELHFPTVTLQWTAISALEALRAELRPHGDAH